MNETTQTKICLKCKIEKNITEFSMRTDQPLKRRGQCIICRNEYWKFHHIKNKDKHKIQHHNNYLKNEGNIKEKKQKLKLSNPAKHLWGSISKNARISKIEFNVEIDDIIIPNICPIFGIPLFFTRRTNNK